MRKGLSLESFRNELAAWLASVYGLQMAVFGDSSIDHVLDGRRRTLGLDTEAEYAGYWRRDDAEKNDFLEQLLVGETWFFREWPAFGLLAEWIKSRFVQYTHRNPLRILTLPCATGEEAWSIAAVVFESGLDSRSVLIDALDISLSSLGYAARGLYPQRRLRTQPLERWAHLFIPHAGNLLRISDDLRSLVRFGQANAMDRDSLLKRGPYDVIFCRNMMIYMGIEARTQVCRTMSQCLRSDGLLFLGHAETVPAEVGLIKKNDACAFAWMKDEVAGRSVIQPIPARFPPQAVMKSDNPRDVTQRPFSSSRPPILKPDGSPPLRPAAGNQPAEGGAVQTSAGDSIAQPTIDLGQLQQLGNLGRYAEALQLVETPLATQSLDPDIHAFAGVLLGALDRKSEAMVRLRRAIYLDPFHAESLTHLALLLEERGDLAEAKRLRARLDQAMTRGNE